MGNFSNETRKKPEYTFVVFKKAGTYTNSQGDEAPILEPIKTISDWYASNPDWKKYVGVPDTDDYIVKVTRHGEDHFEDFADVLQRRDDLSILKFITNYGNRGEVYTADEFIPLEFQLRFKWQELLDNYRSILSDDKEENKARLQLLELIDEYRTGNRNLMVQEYLDKAASVFASDLQRASGYLRLFAEQDFIELTDFFTIRPKKVKEFYDSHFETRLKSGRW